MDTLIVGAGIAGSSLARAFRAAGRDVTVIAPAEATHSHAALAVVRRGYHPKEQRAFVVESLALLHDWNSLAGQGAIVSNYRTPGTRRYDGDWTLIDPVNPLVTPDVNAVVTRIEGQTAICADGRTFAARQILVCPGADSPFTPREWTITHGCTWVHDDPTVLRLPDDGSAALRVHHLAPYKSIVAGVVNGQARLGSSSGKNKTDAVLQATKMLDAMKELGCAAYDSGWRMHYGQRAQGSWLTRRPWGWVVGGLHRTGYALAPALAQDFVRRNG